MVSIFTKIIQREIPAHIVAETDEFIAFLDINPLAKGHCLALPKKEVDYIYDLDDETLAGLNIFAKKVAIAIKKVVPCLRMGVTIIGTEVPHAHIHLIPLNHLDDMNFTKPKMCLENEEIAQIAKDIRAEVVL
jgi:histidine triad (HIT) family protein